MVDDTKVVKTFNLCGTQSNPCCPELREHEDGTFSITDDFGGLTRLSRAELLQLNRVLLNRFEVG